MGRRVWLHEVFSFVFRDRVREDGRSVADFLGAPQDHEEEASRAVRRLRTEKLAPLEPDVVAARTS